MWSFSQLIHVILFSSLFCPHQKFLTILVNSSQIESGILKQLTKYVKTAWATTLIIISLPTLDKSFSFQLANLVANFSLRHMKMLLLD